MVDNVLGRTERECLLIQARQGRGGRESTEAAANNSAINARMPLAARLPAD